MYTLVKTCKKNDGTPYKKVLCGTSRVGAAFVRLPDSTNVITWKTVKGARQFVEARSTFKSGHTADGSTLTIELYDTRYGTLHEFASI